MTCLKCIQVSDSIFNQILHDFEFKVRIEKDLHLYYKGYYENRDLIYYNGTDEFICKEYIVNNYTGLIKNCTCWKQIRVRRAINMQKEAIETISGSRAKAYINKMLKKVYSDAEIEERLHMFEAEYDPDLKQVHYNYPAPENTIIKLTNTYKFDINGAHLDALCEIFPKAREFFQKMYEKRKQKPTFKQYPNLYVGMLAQKSKAMRKAGILGKYEKTYNWIVQRTTKLLNQAIDTVNGQLVYANTDGFIVQNPQSLLVTSKTLGEFKLEHAGDTYIYSDRNYIIYQTGDELKGSCFTSARSSIDLFKGIVAHYTIKTTKNENGETLFRDADNITTERLPIYEI